MVIRGLGCYLCVITILGVWVCTSYHGTSYKPNEYLPRQQASRMQPVVDSIHFDPNGDRAPPPPAPEVQKPDPAPVSHDAPSATSFTENEKNIRKEALKNVEADRRELLKLANGTDHVLFYRAIKRGALCRNNERIGASGDGGKQACNVKAVRKNECTLVSLGLHNQIDYDQAIHQATGGHCKILGVDRSVQNPETQKIYEKIGGQLFVGMIPTEITLPNMLQKAGRNEVELLKIDIEGGEFTGLEPLIRDHLVCQIMIEIHGKPNEHLDLLRVMARYGFRIFNVEPNPFCKKCCEYSLINELCMTQFGAIPLGNTIPN